MEIILLLLVTVFSLFLVIPWILIFLLPLSLVFLVVPALIFAKLIFLKKRPEAVRQLMLPGAAKLTGSFFNFYEQPMSGRQRESTPRGSDFLRTKPTREERAKLA